MNEKGIPGRGKSGSKDSKWSVRAEQGRGKVGGGGGIASRKHWVEEGKYSEHSCLERSGRGEGGRWCLADSSTWP